jgi:Uncharacterised nucleotidyltransferase
MKSSYLQSSVVVNASIEEQLLLCCARTDVNDDIANQVNLLIQQNIDWDKLIELSINHQIHPLLYQNLQRICAGFLPVDFTIQLRELTYKNIASSMSLTAKLIDLIGLFAAENIPVIPYKGSVLAASIYQDLCLRQSYDIDLFVDSQDIAKSALLLISQGYKLDQAEYWEQSFVHFETGVTVDLHQGMAQSYYPFRLEFESCIQRCQKVDLLNYWIPSFSTEDLLLVLSIQIVKDSYSRTCTLAKVCDISELIYRNSGIEWQLVVDRATSIGCQRLLLLGILLANKLLGTVLPELMWKLIKKDWVVWQYGKILANDFFCPDNLGFPSFLLKIIILIEYPLRSSHNLHLLKSILIYPYRKISDLKNNQNELTSTYVSED